MSNTVPCTGNCGVANHVAGSEAHRVCQARTAAMAAHPAGKGRGTAEAVSSDFSDPVADAGRRQAEEYLADLDESLPVSDRYRSVEEIRAEVAEIDAELERLTTPHPYDVYDSGYATARRGGEITAKHKRRTALVTALADQVEMRSRVSEDVWEEMARAEHTRQKVNAIVDATTIPPHGAVDRARHKALNDELDALVEQLEDFRADHGNPWQEMAEERRAGGLVGRDFVVAEQERLHRALSSIDAEDLLDR